uniref:NAD(P)H-quinone oxidoreductase subunit 2, chloroplastic n=1 Tax=Vittaria graminifolia TaxID=38648 RepID=A0A3G5CU47_9MONI|nr:NADH dehydrogenase subunit 2 [Vittaria graminifolia]AYW16399.1 NADH dehydrogenase subunit 2 [Vittaria graminifolia]
MNSITRFFLRLIPIFVNLPIFPEIIVISSLTAIIIIDLFWRGKNTILLYRIAMSSLLVSLVFLLYQSQIIILSQYFDSIDFGNIFRILILICSLLSISLSVDYVICSKLSLGEFLLFKLSACLGGMVLSYANDLLTIYVSLEFLALSSCFLSGYTKRDMRSNEASTKFLMISGVSSSFLLYGFSLLYAISGGQLQLDKIMNGINLGQFGPVTYIATAFITAGTSFKLSLFPFHQWTPDVYEGSPTPVVAFFSITSKVAALALFTRLFSLIFRHLPNEWHIVIGLLTIFSMVAGNLIAITQKSIKRMLAYSSISQIGYIMIGLLAADSENRYASMMTYIFLYIFMNLGTFACITLFGLRTGTDNIRDYAGVYMKDPVLTFSMVLRLPSLGGMPPSSGFFGKLYLFWHGWKAGSYPSVLVALISSVISIYYYLKIIKSMFTGKIGKTDPTITSRQNSLASPSLSIPKNSLEIAMIICALASSLSGILIDPIIEITRKTIF